MEPRPQRPRPGQGRPQQSSQQPGGRSPQHPPGQGDGEGASSQQYQQQHPELAGYPEGVDPTAFVAPPRTEYDYSPLDLAPSGQRRRRQFVAAAAGGLVVLLVVAVVVLAYLFLSDDQGVDDQESQLAAQQDEVATLEAQLTAVAEDSEAVEADEGVADSPAASPPADEADDDAAALEGTDPDDPSFAIGDSASTPGELSGEDQEQSTEDEAAEEAANAEEAPEGDETVSEGQVLDLLPDEALLPQGLNVTEDSEFDFTEVVGSLGGGREVEQTLEEWGWVGHAQRVFAAANPEALAPDATVNIVVSVHVFESQAAAQEALPFYSDLLLESYQEVEDVPDVGDSARLLIQEQAEGGQSVSLYVQQGPVLYRFIGYSPGGNPTANVVNVAESLLGSE